MKATKLRAIVCALGVVTIAACGSKAPPPHAGGPEVLAGGALFQYRNADAERVNLVGDFNGWDPKADPMADEIANHRTPLRFRVILNRPPDIPDRIAGFDHRDTAPEALPGNADDFMGCRSGCAGKKCFVGVGIIPV